MILFTVDLPHYRTPYSPWTCATRELPTYCGPPQLRTTLLTFDLSLEKHWRFGDFAFLRWWLHASVLLPKTLPKFSTLAPSVWYIETQIWQFCINFEICGHYGNLLKLHFNVLLSTNRGDKVLNSIQIWWPQDHRVQRRHVTYHCLQKFVHH